VTPVISIGCPTSTDDLDEVRRLMREFVAWHRERHQEDAHLIDAYFDPAAFEDELAHLAEKYTPPDGDLLLARCDGQEAGCVALRRLDRRACEMKRMFVDPRFQGSGIGRSLAEAVIEVAKASGYAVMRLDTSKRQAEAQRLYRKLGFREISSYNDLPQPLIDWLVFMERDL
jgi:putative acetyltransferase